MSSKTLNAFLIGLIVLVSVVSWIAYRHPSHGMLSVEGSALLETLSLSDISDITIEGPEGNVSLTKKSDRWVVTDRYDYPADFKKISDFVQSLQAARIGRQFPIRNDIRDRLKLNPPEADLESEVKGTRVVFKNRDGDVLTQILFGRGRRLDGTGAPDSHYVMLVSDPSVYLVDTPFTTLAKDPSDWLDTPIIEAPAKLVRKIECFAPGVQTPTYVFEREYPEENLVPVISPTSLPLDDSVIKKIEWSITYLPLEDVAPPDVDPTDTGLAGSLRLDYYLFDGMIYRVYPCMP
ncbi:MAG: DUF4340 domain-containing protein, partial [Deltaproteobacteria bacterium]|nr:DUF4340 domain-containing protein [Deltaproteobacteria bacterium]